MGSIFKEEFGFSHKIKNWWLQKPNEIVQVSSRLELKATLAYNQGHPLKNFITEKDVCP